MVVEASRMIRIRDNTTPLIVRGCYNLTHWPPTAGLGAIIDIGRLSFLSRPCHLAQD